MKRIAKTTNHCRQMSLCKAEASAGSTASVRRGTAPDKVEEKVEKALSNFFYRETRRKPVVTAALMEV